MGQNKKRFTWTAADEMNAIEFMASGKGRGINKIIPTIEDRKERIQNWIITSFTRRWSEGINLTMCRKFAEERLTLLGVEK